LSRSNLGLIHLVFVHFSSLASHGPLFEFLLHVEGWMIVRVLEYIVWIMTVKSSAGRHTRLPRNDANGAFHCKAPGVMICTIELTAGKVI
jgi:hypothetical protein